MPYWHHMTTGWGWPTLALTALVLVALGVALVWTLRRARPEDDALRILDERFARGEIDEEEYQRRRTELLG